MVNPSSKIIHNGGRKRLIIDIITIDRVKDQMKTPLKLKTPKPKLSSPIFRFANVKLPEQNLKIHTDTLLPS